MDAEGVAASPDGDAFEGSKIETEVELPRGANAPRGTPPGILRVDSGKSRRTSLDIKLLTQHEPASPQPSVDRLSVTFAEDSQRSDRTESSPKTMDKVHFPIGNTDEENSDDEDYSASVTAIMQRRASTRRSKRRSGRRGSSPFSPDILPDNDSGRRRSSVFTTSSGDTAITMEDSFTPSVTQDQIFENIKLHKEVLGSVKMQPWNMRKKLRLVMQAKEYIKKHEGALQERLAQSHSTKDMLARCNIFFIKKWQHFRREAANLSNWLIPWEKRIKEIESHFGSVVASYFIFLRWLFWVNMVISIVLIALVAVPEMLMADFKKDPERKTILPEDRYNSTNFLTLWDFEGVFKYSPMFYGWYTNLDLVDKAYRLPLAYFFTGLAVYVYSFVATLRKMAKNSRMSKLSEKEDECIFSWKLFTGWDYMIGNAETAHNRVASIVMSFKEALLEEAEKKRESKSWKLIGSRILVNTAVLGLLFLSAFAVITVVARSNEKEANSTTWRRNEITVVMSLISLFFPILFELLGYFEHYHPRKQLRLQLARIMVLNLLNLYSLIFALFGKISNMTNDLQALKPPNITSSPQNSTTKFPLVSPTEIASYNNCYTICEQNGLEIANLISATLNGLKAAPTVETMQNTLNNFSSIAPTPVDLSNVFKIDLSGLKNKLQDFLDEITDEGKWDYVEATTQSAIATTVQDFSSKIENKCRQHCENLNETLLKPVLSGYQKRSKLRSLCWETMFGQELVKLTVMDLVMTVLSSLAIDFLRGLFVRYMNNFWCWDLEKTFPQYGDFKVAENILHLVNNQGMVWMGMFFSPGLVVLNVIKLYVMMYLRSWAVLACNVPHEIIFRASRSNNFYFALLLMMLFLCVLPVGYTIVWLEPSWHCGPFSKYHRIFHIFTKTIRKALPEPFHKILDYTASPGIVIPLLMLLVLIIYYLISLTNALREANNDLKVQLRRERTEERRKMFQIADKRRRSGSGGSGELNQFGKWKKLLQGMPGNKSSFDETPKEISEIEEQQQQAAAKKVLSRFIFRSIKNKKRQSEENQDDGTDTEQHESLPDDASFRLKMTKPDSLDGHNRKLESGEYPGKRFKPIKLDSLEIGGKPFRRLDSVDSDNNKDYQTVGRKHNDSCESDGKKLSGIKKNVADSLENEAKKGDSEINANTQNRVVNKIKDSRDSEINVNFENRLSNRTKDSRDSEISVSNQNKLSSKIKDSPDFELSLNNGNRLGNKTNDGRDSEINMNKEDRLSSKVKDSEMNKSNDKNNAPPRDSEGSRTGDKNNEGNKNNFDSEGSKHRKNKENFGRGKSVDLDESRSKFPLKKTDAEQQGNFDEKRSKFQLKKMDSLEPVLPNQKRKHKHKKRHDSFERELKRMASVESRKKESFLRSSTESGDRKASKKKKNKDNINRVDSITSNWSDNIPVITISKTESSESILEAVDVEVQEAPAGNSGSRAMKLLRGKFGSDLRKSGENSGSFFKSMIRDKDDLKVNDSGDFEKKYDRKVEEEEKKKRLARKGKHVLVKQASQFQEKDSVFLEGAEEQGKGGVSGKESTTGESSGSGRTGRFLINFFKSSSSDKSKSQKNQDERDSKPAMNLEKTGSELKALQEERLVITGSEKIKYEGNSKPATDLGKKRSDLKTSKEERLEKIDCDKNNLQQNENEGNSKSATNLEKGGRELKTSKEKMGSDKNKLQQNEDEGNSSSDKNKSHRNENKGDSKPKTSLGEKRKSKGNEQKIGIRNFFGKTKSRRNEERGNSNTTTNLEETESKIKSSIENEGNTKPTMSLEEKRTHIKKSIDQKLDIPNSSDIKKKNEIEGTFKQKEKITETPNDQKLDIPSSSGNKKSQENENEGNSKQKASLEERGTKMKTSKEKSGLARFFNYKNKSAKREDEGNSKPTTKETGSEIKSPNDNEGSSKPKINLEETGFEIKKTNDNKGNSKPTTRLEDKGTKLKTPEGNEEQLEIRFCFDKIARNKNQTNYEEIGSKIETSTEFCFDKNNSPEIQEISKPTTNFEGRGSKIETSPGYVGNSKPSVEERETILKASKDNEEKLELTKREGLPFVFQLETTNDLRKPVEGINEYKEKYDALGNEDNLEINGKLDATKHQEGEQRRNELYSTKDQELEKRKGGDNFDSTKKQGDYLEVTEKKNKECEEAKGKRDNNMDKKKGNNGELETGNKLNSTLKTVEEKGNKFDPMKDKKEFLKVKEERKDKCEETDGKKSYNLDEPKENKDGLKLVKQKFDSIKSKEDISQATRHDRLEETKEGEGNLKRTTENKDELKVATENKFKVARDNKDKFNPSKGKEEEIKLTETSENKFREAMKEKENELEKAKGNEDKFETRKDNKEREKQMGNKKWGSTKDLKENLQVFEEEQRGFKKTKATKDDKESEKQMRIKKWGATVDLEDNLQVSEEEPKGFEKTNKTIKDNKEREKQMRSKKWGTTVDLEDNLDASEKGFEETNSTTKVNIEIEKQMRNKQWGIAVDLEDNLQVSEEGFEKTKGDEEAEKEITIKKWGSTKDLEDNLQMRRDEQNGSEKTKEGVYKDDFLVQKERGEKIKTAKGKENELDEGKDEIRKENKLENRKEEDELETMKETKDELETTKGKEGKLEDSKGKGDELKYMKGKEEKMENTKGKEVKLEYTKEKEEKLKTAKGKENKLEDSEEKRNKLKNMKGKEEEKENTGKEEGILEYLEEKEDKLENMKGKEEQLENTKVEERKLEDTKEKEGKVETTKGQEDKLEDSGGKGDILKTMKGKEEITENTKKEKITYLKEKEEKLEDMKVEEKIENTKEEDTKEKEEKLETMKGKADKLEDSEGKGDTLKNMKGKEENTENTKEEKITYLKEKEENLENTKGGEKIENTKNEDAKENEEQLEITKGKEDHLEVSEGKRDKLKYMKGIEERTENTKEKEEKLGYLKKRADKLENMKGKEEQMGNTKKGENILEDSEGNGDKLKYMKRNEERKENTKEKEDKLENTKVKEDKFEIIKAEDDKFEKPTGKGEKYENSNLKEDTFETTKETQDEFEKMKEQAEKLRLLKEKRNEEKLNASKSEKYKRETPMKQNEEISFDNNLNRNEEICIKPKMEIDFGETAFKIDEFQLENNKNGKFEEISNLIGNEESATSGNEEQKGKEDFCESTFKTNPGKSGGLHAETNKVGEKEKYEEIPKRIENEERKTSGNYDQKNKSGFSENPFKRNPGNFYQSGIEVGKNEEIANNESRIIEEEDENNKSVNQEELPRHDCLQLNKSLRGKNPSELFSESSGEDARLSPEFSEMKKDDSEKSCSSDESGKFDTVKRRKLLRDLNRPENNETESSTEYKDDTISN